MFVTKLDEFELKNSIGYLKRTPNQVLVLTLKIANHLFKGDKQTTFSKVIYYSLIIVLNPVCLMQLRFVFICQIVFTFYDCDV